jgi:uncharacterized membrane protein
MFNTAHFHPMIVHFPIALIMAGFLAEVVSLFFKSEKCLSKAGFYLLLLGTLSAVVAWSTGKLFTNEPTQGPVMQIFELHETGGLITMILMLLASAFRIYLVVEGKEETVLKWIAFGIYFLGFSAVAFTGYMGGSMVYDFMMPL